MALSDIAAGSRLACTCTWRFYHGALAMTSLIALAGEKLPWAGSPIYHARAALRQARRSGLSLRDVETDWCGVPASAFSAAQPCLFSQLRHETRGNAGAPILLRRLVIKL